MKKFFGSSLLLMCLMAPSFPVWAQEPSPLPEITSTPIQVRSDVHVDVQQAAPEPAPEPAPAPQVNVELHDSAPTAPSVVKTESVKETSVTKIQTPTPTDSGNNVMYLVVGGVVAFGLALGIYGVTKRS